MAYETGTVTDLADLIDAIRNFVTSHADLIADGQEWTELSYVASGANGVIGQTYFQAPGLDGTEEIIVGMRPLRYADIGRVLDRLAYGARLERRDLRFFTNRAHRPKNSCRRAIRAMEYWFVANGRRLIGVVKISTVYTSFYIGKILPWGSTGDYPLPFLLGCNTEFRITCVGRSEAWDFAIFFDPGHGAARY